MNKILVTGGAGFIGSHTSAQLLREGFEVVIVDDFNDYYDPRQKERNVQPLIRAGARLERLDIRDAASVEAVITREKPQTIVHLAARAGVRPSIQNPLLYEEVNVRGTLHVLEAARRAGVQQFIFASSSSVYGTSADSPFSEDQPVDHPLSPYAATKKSGELLAYTAHHLYGLKATCLRFFTVYGPAGRPDMAPYLFTEAIAHGRPIKRFGDGSSQRDYTYIADIVSGVVAAVHRPFEYEIINLGNHQTVALSRFIEVIEKVVGKKAIIEAHPEQPGDVPLTYANINKAKRLLGYEPKTSIEAGMRNFVEWWKNREVNSC